MQANGIEFFGWAVRFARDGFACMAHPLMCEQIRKQWVHLNLRIESRAAWLRWL